MIGRRLRDALQMRQMSQADLAREIKQAPQTINQWATDKTTPDLESIVHIVKALRISADYLLGLTDKPTAYVDPALTPAEYRILAIMDEADELTALEKFVAIRKEQRKAEKK